MPSINSCRVIFPSWSLSMRLKKSITRDFLWFIQRMYFFLHTSKSKLANSLSWEESDNPLDQLPSMKKSIAKCSWPTINSYNYRNFLSRNHNDSIPPPVCPEHHWACADGQEPVAKPAATCHTAGWVEGFPQRPAWLPAAAAAAVGVCLQRADINTVSSQMSNTHIHTPLLRQSYLFSKSQREVTHELLSSQPGCWEPLQAFSCRFWSLCQHQVASLSFPP